MNTVASLEWLAAPASPYIDAIEQHRDLERLPFYSSGGKWVAGKGWANGFAIGAYLLCCRLLGRQQPPGVISTWLDELAQHMSTPRFQDVGFIGMYSTVLACELGLVDKRRVAPIADYLSGCAGEDGALHVEWKPGCRLSVDQFMNSMLLGWSALSVGRDDTTAWDRYLRVVRCAANELLQQGCAFEYREHSGVALTVNAESNSWCWLRGQAWALVGLAYAGHTARKLGRDDPLLTEAALQLVEMLIDALTAFGRLPASFARDHSDACDLEDTSAQAAIACALLFLANRGVLSTPSTTRLLNYTSARLHASLGVNGQILTNVSYPKRLISGAGECSAWGDYFALRFLLESVSSEESRIDII